MHAWILAAVRRHKLASGVPIPCGLPVLRLYRAFATLAATLAILCVCQRWLVLGRAKYGRDECGWLPSHKSRSVLGALPYRDNEVILHTDTRLLPKLQRAWSSWNYRLKPGSGRATVTYNMNILQGLDAPETFCVTLNDTASINPHRILGRFNYAHPQFTLAGMEAQQRWGDINGQNGTWFCGAYWQNGFHEDGLSSGLRVAESLCAAAQMAA